MNRFLRITISAPVQSVPPGRLLSVIELFPLCDCIVRYPLFGYRPIGCATFSTVTIFTLNPQPWQGACQIPLLSCFHPANRENPLMIGSYPCPNAANTMGLPPAPD